MQDAIPITRAFPMPHNVEYDEGRRGEAAGGWWEKGWWWERHHLARLVNRACAVQRLSDGRDHTYRMKEGEFVRLVIVATAAFVGGYVLGTCLGLRGVGARGAGRNDTKSGARNSATNTFDLIVLWGMAPIMCLWAFLWC